MNSLGSATNSTIQAPLPPPPPLLMSLCTACSLNQRVGPMNPSHSFTGFLLQYSVDQCCLLYTVVWSTMARRTESQCLLQMTRCRVYYSVLQCTVYSVQCTTVFTANDEMYSIQCTVPYSVYTVFTANDEMSRRCHQPGVTGQLEQRGRHGLATSIQPMPLRTNSNIKSETQHVAFLLLQQSHNIINHKLQIQIYTKTTLCS